jgi:hypothetical protein
VNRSGDGNPIHFITTAELFGVSTDLTGLLGTGSIIGIENLAATPLSLAPRPARP